MKKLVKAIVSVVIVLSALAFTLVDALVPLKFWTHPILNFFFILFAGFGIYYIISGLMFKSVGTYFCGASLTAVALIYVLAQYLVWWLIILILIVWLSVSGIIGNSTVGGHTEYAKNKDKDYKTFDERKAEEKAKAETETDKEQELPELKSFKD